MCVCMCVFVYIYIHIDVRLYISLAFTYLTKFTLPNPTSSRTCTQITLKKHISDELLNNIGIHLPDLVKQYVAQATQPSVLPPFCMGVGVSVRCVTLYSIFIRLPMFTIILTHVLLLVSIFIRSYVHTLTPMLVC